MENETSKCKYCSKEITIVAGRRPREFCQGSSCRTNYWRENNDPNKNSVVVMNTADWKIITKEKRHEVTAKSPEAIEVLKQRLKDLYSPTKKDAPVTAIESVNEARLGLSPAEIKKHNAEVDREIELMRKKPIPKDRDTAFGRKLWAIEVNKEVEALEKAKL